MWSLINAGLTIFFLFLVWMFNKIKKIYTQLNKRNTKVPDIEILKKIVPPLSEIGWRINTVCNGIPLWIYKSSFTFAPNITIGRIILQQKSHRVLEELVNIDVFTQLFPGYPLLKVEKANPDRNQDLVTLSNINTSLSLTSIVSCHLSHTNFSLERFWFFGTDASWLYMCPTNVLLADTYGYWISFIIQDLPNGNGAVLYILGSFPSSVCSNNINQLISSSLVLAKEHVDAALFKNFIPQEREDVKVKRSPKSSTSLTATSKRRSPSHVKPTLKSSTHQEAVGYEEEPAIIQRISSTEQLSQDEKVADMVDNAVTTNPSKLEETVQTLQSTSELHEKIELKDKALLPEVIEKLSKYENVLVEGFNTLLAVYEADDDTPSWQNMGFRDGVQIYRKDADEVSASGCYKGTSDVNVPLNYLFTYLTDLEFKKEYDNLFENGTDVELLGDGLTKIVSLQYQSVWPTTGRDFCSISALRHLKDHLYGIMVKAVVHPSCPPSKNKVRGEVIIGGYVLNLKSTNPPVISLTYITRVELKGSIPQRLINRVNAEQPMFAAAIRRHCERRYEIQDPPRDTKDWLSLIHSSPSMFKQPVNGNENEACDNSSKNDQEELQEQKDNSDDFHETMTSEKSLLKENLDDRRDDDKCDGEEKEKSDDSIEDRSTLTSNGFDLRENYYAPIQQNLELPPRLPNEDVLINDTQSLDEISQFTEDLHTQLSISDQQLDLPRDLNGQIDFVTLGNQTAAGLEEEFLVTRDLINDRTRTVTNGAVDEWIHQGINKNVVIMKKIHSKQKFHSFLGCGIINVLPVTVWEAVRNPTTRFVYDNMLKRITVVKEISERNRIVHMRHETHACFVKQARDFCLLTVERVEKHRYLLGASSVDIPECPPVRDCVRAIVLSSGWIIEPILHNGRSCSKVTYISQVNFGGHLPTRLINFISKRQPLALAYLRDYLESSEM